MSQTVPQQTAVDTYLAAQVAPPQTIEIDQKYGNIRMVTPVGRLAYVTFMKPRASTRDDGTKGPESYSATLLLNPASCNDLYNAICMLANFRWPSQQLPDPENNGQLRTYTGAELLFRDPKIGGIHYPIRDGNQSYMRDPVKFKEWRGQFFVNASTQAVNAKTGMSMAPVYKDENGHDCRSDLMYSGCYGRLQITLFTFPKQGVQGQGQRGIGIALNAAQFACHGEKLSSFDASKAAGAAFSAAGAMQANPNAAPPSGNYGPHQGSPSTVPPGAGFAAPPGAGFAAPPQQPQYAPQQPQQPTQPQYVPQQPTQPAQPQYAPQPVQPQYAPQQPTQPQQPQYAPQPQQPQYAPQQPQQQYAQAPAPQQTQQPPQTYAPAPGAPQGYIPPQQPQQPQYPQGARPPGT